MTAPIADEHRRNHMMPQVVQSGPRTAGVLRFHRPAPEPAAGSVRPRTSGTSALAPEPALAAARRLHAVPAPGEAEEVRKLAAAITLATMEVLAGTRPIAQLSPWLHRDLLGPVQLRADLRRAAGAAAAGAAGAGAPRTAAGGSGPGVARLALVHRAPAVRSAHASPVGPGIYEAAVIVSDAARCRAVALRVEALGRTWQVTALEIG